MLQQMPSTFLHHLAGLESHTGLNPRRTAAAAVDSMAASAVWAQNGADWSVESTTAKTCAPNSAYGQQQRRLHALYSLEQLERKRSNFYLNSPATRLRLRLRWQLRGCNQS